MSINGESLQNETAKSEISQEDFDKIDNWVYRPTDDVYLKHKEVFDNPKYFDQETGETHWPPNNGEVDGTKAIICLPIGTVIDRYGLDTGSYTSPIGVSYEERSLAPGTEKYPYSQFEICKPINVEQSVVFPWFDEPGGGIQYRMPSSIKDLLDRGIIRRIQ